MKIELMNVDEIAKEYREGFALIPLGWHNVRATKIRKEPNSKKTGDLIIFTLTLEEGESVIEVKINYTNPSIVSQQIGRAEIAKIAQVIGHQGDLDDLDFLIGRLFSVKIIHEEFKSNKTGKILKSNKVDDYAKAMSVKEDKPESKVSETSNTDKEMGWE